MEAGRRGRGEGEAEEEGMLERILEGGWWRIVEAETLEGAVREVRGW